MREIVIGGAQLGAIQKGEERASVVARMIALLERASGEGCTLVVFPELALTTFFPRWYMEDPDEIDVWFEREMPNAASVAAGRGAHAVRRADRGATGSRRSCEAGRGCTPVASCWPSPRASPRP